LSYEFSVLSRLIVLDPFSFEKALQLLAAFFGEDARRHIQSVIEPLVLNYIV